MMNCFLRSVALSYWFPAVFIRFKNFSFQVSRFAECSQAILRVLSILVWFKKLCLKLHESLINDLPLFLDQLLSKVFDSSSSLSSQDFLGFNLGHGTFNFTFSSFFHL